MLVGINGRLRSEGGSSLQSGDLRLRQHGGDDLDALCAELVVTKTASTELDAC